MSVNYMGNIVCNIVCRSRRAVSESYHGIPYSTPLPPNKQAPNKNKAWSEVVKAFLGRAGGGGGSVGGCTPGSHDRLFRQPYMSYDLQSIFPMKFMPMGPI